MNGQSPRDTQRLIANRWRTRAACSLFVVTAAGLGAGAALDSPPHAGPANVFWAASFLAFPVVGLVLTIKLPTNAVGWLLVAGPGLVLWGVAVQESGAAGVGETLFAAGLVTIISAFVVFPDGRYPNRIWRYGHSLAILGLLIEPQISAASDGGISVGTLLILAVGSLVYRVFRGTSTERRQIGLPVLVVISGIGLILLASVLPIESTGDTGDTAADWISVLLVAYLLIGIPVAIGVSVLRYRLYDFDRIVSRTVSYTVLITLLTVLYVGATAMLTQFLPDQSDLAVAASTLAVAALFNPTRLRVQRTVDRRFDRSRYNAEMIVEIFATKLRNQVDLAEIVSDWLNVVDQTVKPASASIWIRYADPRATPNQGRAHPLSRRLPRSIA